MILMRHLPEPRLMGNDKQMFVNRIKYIDPLRMVSFNRSSLHLSVRAGNKKPVNLGLLLDRMYLIYSIALSSPFIASLESHFMAITPLSSIYSQPSL